MTDTPPLVAVAHGSRDPWSATTVAALTGLVRHQRADLDIRLCFLDFSAPRLGDVLGAVCAEGHRRAVVVPLLLGHAFHARVDVPGAVRHARRPGLEITVADVLGEDPRLVDTALHRLAEVTGPLDDPDLGVVLAGAGSSHAPANAVVHRLVAGWTQRFGWSGGSAAFAAAAEPTVPSAVAALRAGGARRIAVAQWFLAPGLLPGRVVLAAQRAGAGRIAVADPLGPAADVAAVIVHRYQAAARATDLGARRVAG
ncbi:MAG: sirohydrochlorin chelatase [Pseudonocardia sp.]